MSQNEQILDHLRRYGTITPMQAIKRYRITRLAARIYDLERQGYVIKHKLMQWKTALGKPTKYCLYRMEG